MINQNYNLLNNTNLATTNVLGELSPNETFKGCNSEEIQHPSRPFSLPRTLYHLLFIYFALEENKFDVDDTSKYLISQDSEWLQINDKEQIDYSKSRYADYWKDYSVRYEKSRSSLHLDISNFLEKQHLNPENLNWQQVLQVVNKVWDGFGDLQSKISMKGDRLPFKFYRYIYKYGDPAKELITRSIGEEWRSEKDTTILYRSAVLKDEGLMKKHENYKHCKKSLSFHSSIVAGIVFEGLGTAPLAYQLEYDDRDLFGVKLSSKKLQRYFFWTKQFEGLYPLVTKGELSHPRNKIYLEDSDDFLDGVACVGDARKVTAFNPIDKPAIKNFADFENKLRKIYNSNLILLSDKKFQHK